MEPLYFSYNIHAVWKAYGVPLHPGAARYYKERGYMSVAAQSAATASATGVRIKKHVFGAACMLCP